MLPLDAKNKEAQSPATESRQSHHDTQNYMATPKGMRAVRLPVNSTDAVHVYSDEQHIWIQLRRDVPTEQDIGRPSFKTALCLTHGTAHKLGLELLNVAARNKDKQKAKNPPAAKPLQPKAKHPSSAPTAK